VEWKTVAVDCRQLCFRFVVILPPKFEKAKFSKKTGITPKSNENSEVKKENRSKTNFASYPVANRK